MKTAVSRVTCRASLVLAILASACLTREMAAKDISPPSAGSSTEDMIRKLTAMQTEYNNALDALKTRINDISDRTTLSEQDQKMLAHAKDQLSDLNDSLSQANATLQQLRDGLQQQQQDQQKTQKELADLERRLKDVGASISKQTLQIDKFRETTAMKVTRSFHGIEVQLFSFPGAKKIPLQGKTIVASLQVEDGPKKPYDSAVTDADGITHFANLVARDVVSGTVLTIEFTGDDDYRAAPAVRIKIRN